MNQMVDILRIYSREELVRILGCSMNTDLYAFFADPAEHSLSPLMYNKAFEILNMDSLYFASRVPAGCMGDAMDKVRALGIKGFNVSMPHKQDVIKYLDELDSVAGLCNAVNTVRVIQNNNDTKLVGYNTDATGFISALREMDIETEGVSATILGFGGAGKAVVSGLVVNGASHIHIFVRNPRKLEYHDFIQEITNEIPGVIIGVYGLSDNASLNERIRQSSILINTTNVGMGEYKGLSLLPDKGVLHKELSVMDLIYSPPVTRLMEQSQNSGCRNVTNGLSMLIHQGKDAFRLYKGVDMPVEEIEKELKEFLSQ